MNQIQQFAKDVMEESQRDLHAALALGADRVASDASLQKAFWEYGVDLAIRQQWRSGHAEYRKLDALGEQEPAPVVEMQPAFGGGQTPTLAPTMNPGLIAAARVSAIRKRFLDYEMPGGRRLVDCSRVEIEQYAGLLAKQSHTLAQVSGWLRSVAALLPKANDRVGDLLREADLARLYRRAVKGAA